MVSIISELQQILLHVVTQLDKLQAPPSERNMWWRRPISGFPFPEVTPYQSFGSLKCRDRRRSENWERASDHVDKCTTVEMEVSDSFVILDKESNSECDVSVTKMVDYDSELDYSVSIENVATVSDTNSDSVMTDSGPESGSQDGYREASDKCDKDTTRSPIKMSSPVKVRLRHGTGQQLQRVQMSSVQIGYGNSGIMDSHNEPDTVQSCQFSSQDEKPPDLTGTNSHSLYDNVVNIKRIRTKAGQLENICEFSI
jgi:hypothetical protein